MTNRIISVIVPCRNEQGHISAFLDAALAQDHAGGDVEFIIADGMSDDGTRAILHRYQEQDARIRVIDNPDRTTPAGLNRAIEAARGEIIARMDVHTVYAQDYLHQCVAVLSESGADNVGGPWHAVGTTYFQAAIALGFQSPFSSGGAASHAIQHEGKVDSVYLGCWHRSVFDRIGPFDPELVRNQDDELSLRLIRSGGTVWQSPRIKSWYHPRSSLAALFRQYAQYGYWKVRVIQKHRLPASIRHLVPACFVGMLLTLALLAPMLPPARYALASLLMLYLVANLAVSLLTCLPKRRLKYAPAMPLVFMSFHFGYGYGFLRGMIDFWLLRRGGSTAFTMLTRPPNA